MTNEQLQQITNEWLAHAKRTLADAVSEIGSFLDSKAEAGELPPSVATKCKTHVQRQVDEAIARAEAQLK